MEKLSLKLGINYESFGFVLPELVIAIAIIIILITGLIERNQKAFVYLILAATALLLSTYFITLNLKPDTGFVQIFLGMLRIEGLSSVLKLFCNIAALFTLIMFANDGAVQQKISEQIILLLSIVLGAHLLLSSNNFIMLLVSIELISISSYLLVAFAFNKTSAEGSMKYFLFGAASTAIMIYGMSWFYGMGGTLEFGSELFFKNLIQQPPLLIFVCGIMLLAGLAFKIAAAPFHIWAPDVYQAARTPVVAFLSTVPKIAGVGILLKIFLALQLFGQSPVNWQLILCVVAFLTIGIGNLGALKQNDAKRLMAWSSIAQTGFLLVAIVANSSEATEALVFYVGIYIISNFLVFGIIQYNEHLTGGTLIAQFRGLGKQSAATGIAMTAGMLSLTGLPPTAGFIAKLLVFTQLWSTWQQNPKTWILALMVFGLINTAVALYYYLRIPYFMFFRQIDSSVEPKSNRLMNYYYLALVLLILWLFFQPGMLMGWINKLNFVL